MSTIMTISITCSTMNEQQNDHIYYLFNDERTTKGTPMRIRLIGAPIDLGADRRGVDIGPNAIRYAGLNEQLQRLGHTVHDIGNLPVPPPGSQPVGDLRLKYLEPIVEVTEELANQVTSALQQNEFPLILGGDHSIALGSVAGVAKVHKNIGVLWIDAHADFNTPDT